MFVADIIEHYGEAIAAEVNQSLTDLKDQPALIQLWCGFQHKVQNKLAQGESCACLLGAMSAEISIVSPLCRDVIETVEQQWVQTLQHIIAAAQQQGDLRDDIAAEELAPVLYNFWQGCLLQYQAINNPSLLMQRLWVFCSPVTTPQGQITFDKNPICRQKNSEYTAFSGTILQLRPPPCPPQKRMQYQPPYSPNHCRLRVRTKAKTVCLNRR